MDPSFQVRKLPPSLKMELVQVLELNESWKKLMAIIPEALSGADFDCAISASNPAKYRSEHFRLIEHHALRDRIPCTHILLREWGTSGRVLPTLGHLKHLLERAELFRAADYVTVNLLQQQPPRRPERGPAAPVIPTPEELEDPETRRIEQILDQIAYPSSVIEDINRLNTVDTNINYTDSVKVVPKIVISESPQEAEPPTFTMPLVVHSPKSHSDMIQFSSDLDTAPNLPNLSSLLEEMPTVSEPNLPQLSSLLQSSDRNVPLLSELSALSLEESTNLPALSQLMGAPESQCSRSCTSPLPNLSLDTHLPHFTYAQLETATERFDETPLGRGGRFLGSGAFGKVYLGVGLIDKPVAVKRLLLDDVAEVHVDDTVTKQFRNEVEVLSKYKHENLLSLLGYSCDGCTYCLLYEYIPGGALKDRLQRKELIWTERLYIAMGTAKAIAYLHTAFARPLIHRDVKSANILLDFTNKPKLCDFGLIKLSPTQNTNTGTTIFGTSAYMAPEAFRGDISTKLDTFSFGVVILELLTSLPPLDEDRDGNDLVTHVLENYENDITPALDTSAGAWVANNTHFGRELFNIALTCLREKRKRPTMEDVNRELGQLVLKSV